MPLVSDALWQGLRKFHAMTAPCRKSVGKQSDRQIFIALSDDGRDHRHAGCGKMVK